MAVFTLTTGPDTFVGDPGDNTVNATEATLNPSDSLTGGSGTNTLGLYGGGTFRIDQLVLFTGFQNIAVHDGYGTRIFLGANQPLTVTEDGTAYTSLYLGSGAVTFETVPAGGWSNYIHSRNPNAWNPDDVFEGSQQAPLYLSLNEGNDQNSIYDLTTNTLTGISTLYGNGTNLTVLINSTIAAGVSGFQGSSGEQLETSDSTLDLSHSSVTGFTVASTNSAGTTFIVQDVSTAFQIAGGPGQDTIETSAFTFNADQRNEIFALQSVEKIVDPSGTYTAPAHFALTPGSDTFVGGPGDNTVNATEATLKPSDSLTGGSGTNTLGLYGGGTFRIDQLALFTGFQNIAVHDGLCCRRPPQRRRKRQRAHDHHNDSKRRNSARSRRLVSDLAGTASCGNTIPSALIYFFQSHACVA